MLELINVCKTFNPGTVNAKTALNDLNLTLNDGDFVTVIVGNGRWKQESRPRPNGGTRTAGARCRFDGSAHECGIRNGRPQIGASCVRSIGQFEPSAGILRQLAVVGKRS